MRAAALLPWVLCLLHPRILTRHPAVVAVAALSIQQFLFAAYPGEIVSGFYATAFLTIVWLIRTDDRFAARRYFMWLVLAGTSGVLMSMVKWLTPALVAFGSFVGKLTVYSIQIPHLLTFLFRFGLDALPGDVTMQSLWLPPVALLLIFFVRRISGSLAIYLALAVLALLAGSLESTAPGLRKMLPGLLISRLAHSDWRLPLHIAMALASATAFDLAIRNREMNWRSLVPRAGAVFGATALMASGALATGYSLKDIAPELALIILLVMATSVVLMIDLSIFILIKTNGIYFYRQFRLRAEYSPDVGDGIVWLRCGG